MLSLARMTTPKSPRSPLAGAVIAWLAAALLAGCAGATSQTPVAGVEPMAGRSAVAQPIDLLLPAKTPGGLYVGQFSANVINEYTLPDKNNSAPRCTVGFVGAVNGIGVNAKHVLYVPNDSPRGIYLWAANCGKSLPTLSDGNGQPADVAFDGTTVYVDDATTGGIDVFAHGATAPTGTLSNAAIAGSNFGVAVDGKHNVFESSQTGSGVVVEYAGGKEPGSVLAITGTATPQGLEFDKKGNLLVMDTTNGVLIYAPPYDGAPKHVITPQNFSVYAKLDAANKNLYLSDIVMGTVDAYTYPAGAFEYSISNGLLQGNSVEGIAVDPPAKD